MPEKLKWSPQGVFYLLGGCLLVLVGANQGSDTLTAAGGILLLMLASDAWRTSIRRVSVAVDVAPVRISEKDRASVHVSGRGFHEGHQLHVPLGSGLSLVEGENLLSPRGRHVDWDFTVTGRVRGPHQVGPVTVRRWSAARIWVREQVRDLKEDVEVIPSAAAVEEIGKVSRVVKPMPGRFTVNRPGHGFDFFTLRQYQTGDTMRSVNWKASARRDEELIVNQRQLETHSEVLILLDSRLVSGVGPLGRTPLDRGCRVALGLASEILANRDTLHFASYGDSVTGLMGLARERLQVLQTDLARLPAAGRTRLIDAWGSTQTDLRAVGPIFIITSCEADDSVGSAVQEMVGRGHPVTLISPAPIDDRQGSDRDEWRQHALEAARGGGAVVLNWQEETPLAAEAPRLAVTAP